MGDGFRSEEFDRMKSRSHRADLLPLSAWIAEAAGAIGSDVKEYVIARLIEYEESTGLVREVFDDIRATRQTTDINNFWKALADHPPTLQRTWLSVKEAMTGPGELDPLVRELIYIAVSVTNGCPYCIASHRAAAVSKGMSAAMFGELLGIVGVANMTNRLANGHDVPIDEKFRQL